MFTASSSSTPRTTRPEAKTFLDLSGGVAFDWHRAFGLTRATAQWTASAACSSGSNRLSPSRTALDYANFEVHQLEFDRTEPW